MHQYNTLAGALLASAMAWASTADAALIVQQSPLDGGSAFASYLDQQSAEDFIVPVDTAVTAVRWWGTYLESAPPAADDAFHVRFFTDDGGVPAVAPFAEFIQPPLIVSRTATGLTDTGGITVYQFDVTLPGPVAVSAATTYYLSVVNFFDDVDAEWYWLQSALAGENFFRLFGDAEPWAADESGDLAFALFDARSISEPATLPLAMMVFAALGLWVRRARLSL